MRTGDIAERDELRCAQPVLDLDTPSPVDPGCRERRWTWVRSTAVHGSVAGSGQVYVLRDYIGA